MNNLGNKLKDIVVLYCEDEVELRDITSVVLRQFVKKLYLSDNGEDGLEIFKNNSDEIDVVITDVNMPKMDGLTMVEHIKSINSNIPVIVTTAFSNSEYLLKAINIGVDKYALKPIDIKKLLKVIESSLLYHELQDLYKDSLTHIYSRNKLVKDEKELENPIIALFDIDDFAVINELYGDENGDKILVAFVEKLKNFYDSDFRYYRVGADQFAILTEAIDIDELKEKTKLFVKNIEDNGVNINETTQIFFTLTVVFANTKDKKIYENATRALNFAKKNFIQFLKYDDSLHKPNFDFAKNIAWTKKLKEGLFDGHFKAFFQPIVDVKTQEIIKYEALIRYLDDNGDIVSPAVFLPIAKKAKLFSGIIKLMINESIDFIRHVKKEVSVNLSFEDMNNKETLEYIINKLEQNQDVTNKLHFELLETEDIQDFSLVKNFIDKVHEFGCKIGIDDFGSGYSNFNILEELEIDFIKIDGSLIKNIDQNKNQELLVETIISFAKKIDMKTIAEFVSSPNIYKEIKRIGVDMAQGYHFGKPIPLDEILDNK